MDREMKVDDGREGRKRQNQVDRHGRTVALVVLGEDEVWSCGPPSQMPKSC